MAYDRCMLVSEMLMTSAAVFALGGTEFYIILKTALFQPLFLFGRTTFFHR
jgi:hypothetical protein